MSVNILTNFHTFGTNILSFKSEQTFTALYALWDVLFFSEPLMYSCTLLANTIRLSYDQSRVNMFKISRLLNNISNNFDEAASNYKDVKMFVEEEHIVESKFEE